MTDHIDPTATQTYLGISFQKIPVILLYGHIQLIPVVQSGAAEEFILQRKTERFDQVQRRFGRDAEAADGAGVLGNLRRDQDDVELLHRFSSAFRRIRAT